MRDPVCGCEVGDGGEAAVGPDGREYRFCCAACRWAFERDPRRYARA